MSNCSPDNNAQDNPNIKRYNQENKNAENSQFGSIKPRENQSLLGYRFECDSEMREAGYLKSFYYFITPIVVSELLSCLNPGHESSSDEPLKIESLFFVMNILNALIASYLNTYLFLAA